MKTITIETADLSGSALDWAVAVAIGKIPVLWNVCCGNTVGTPAECCLDPFVKVEVDMKRWEPSTDWSQGGPLIEKFRVRVVYSDDDITPYAVTRECHPALQAGDTVLQAAMRAIVASKLGDTVDVPADMVEPDK